MFADAPGDSDCRCAGQTAVAPGVQCTGWFWVSPVSVPHTRDLLMCGPPDLRTEKMY